MSSFAPYGTLVVPVIVGLGLIWLAIRVARAIVHLIVVALVILLLLWGYTQYQHFAALQSAAQHLAAPPSTGGAGAYRATATSVLAHANAVLAQAGLDPNAIHATVNCSGGTAVLVLTDRQSSGLLGLFGGSSVRVHLSPAVHCAATP
jgi:hypothetical protein